MADPPKRDSAARSPRSRTRLLCAAFILAFASLATGVLMGKSDPWRRTVDGWERSDRWSSVHIGKTEPAVPHPALTATAQALLAVGLLLGLPNGKSRGN